MTTDAASALLILGDNRHTLALRADDTVDAVVCDPPYGLGKEPDMAEVLRHWLAGDDYQATGGGFMGKTWDSFVPGPATWREVYRVLKPGGHLLAFAGSRTVDLMGLAIRLAGFEVRDCLSWLYGSGFPKSLDVSKAIDKAAGAKRPVLGTVKGAGSSDTNSLGAYNPEYAATAPATPAAHRWQGWGTALKPAWEPVLVARKPLAGTVAANVLAHGTGALNIDGCRIGDGVRVNGDASNTEGSGWGMRPNGGKRVVAGRWPANVALDDTAAAMLDEQSGTLAAGNQPQVRNVDGGRHVYGGFDGQQDLVHRRMDAGGASRFYYVAKPSKAERNAGTPDGNKHPTVKPVALMRWLVRLVTPPGGLVLDPFLGSGTTGISALAEGHDFVGYELGPDYLDIAASRIRHHHPDAPVTVVDLATVAK